MRRLISLLLVLSLFCAIFLPIQVTAAAPSSRICNYFLNGSMPPKFIFQNNTITINEGDTLLITWMLARNETGGIEVEANMFSDSANAPFESPLFMERKVLADGADPWSFATRTMQFPWAGICDVTIEATNHTTGGTTIFKFSINVVGTTPPPSKEPENPEPPIEPEPELPVKPDPPVIIIVEEPYSPENDPIWLDLLGQIQSSSSDTRIEFHAPTASDFVPFFILDAAREKNISLVLKWKGQNYYINEASWPMLTTGANYLYETLAALGFTVPPTPATVPFIPIEIDMEGPQPVVLPETAPLKTVYEPEALSPPVIPESVIVQAPESDMTAKKTSSPIQQSISWSSVFFALLGVTGIAILFLILYKKMTLIKKARPTTLPKKHAFR